MKMHSEATKRLFELVQDDYSDETANQLTFIRQAIADGADLDAADREGYTILQRAMATGWGCEKMVIALLEAGANPKVTITRGRFNGLSLLGMVSLNRSNEMRDILFAAGTRLTEADRRYYQEHVTNPHWVTIPINDALIQGEQMDVLKKLGCMATPQLIQDYYDLPFDLELHQRNLAQRQQAKQKETLSLQSSPCQSVEYQGIVRASELAIKR